MRTFEHANVRTTSDPVLVVPGLLAVLFLLMTLVGVWVAYDRSAAWSRFGLIAGGVVLAAGIAWAGQRWPDHAAGLVGTAVGLLGAAVAAYFLLATDWRAITGAKFVSIQRAGLWIQAHRPALPLTEDINSNVAGAALAVLLPLALIGWDYLRRGSRWLALAYGALMAFSFVALLLTASRGAWLGLAAAGVAVAVLYLLRRTSSLVWSMAAAAVALALVILPAVLLWLAVAFPRFAAITGGVAAGASAISRAGLWQNGLALIGDYPYTGCGLGGTMMALSSYVLLLHVGYLPHFHNLMLQIAAEQGAPALSAFSAAVGIAAFAALPPTLPAAAESASGGRPAGRSLASGKRPAGLPPTLPAAAESASGGRPAGRSLASGKRSAGLPPTLPAAAESASGGRPAGRSLASGKRPAGLDRGAGSGQASRPHLAGWAAAAALIALTVHGLVDSGLYVSRLGPVVFLPIGLALAVYRSSAESWPPPELIPEARPAERSLASGTWLAGLALCGVLAAGLGLLPASRAAFQANLAAVAQTRAELSVYAWPKWPIQDALRRAPAVGLAEAVTRYTAALALDPRNAAANRRLGQIELSRGQYDAARLHLEAAYATAPWQRATRQLLAELYAAAGDIKRAATLYRTVDLSQGQIAARVWWHEHLGENDIAARIKKAAE